jgi:type III secretion system FlhB-like substrate exporter
MVRSKKKEVLAMTNQEIVKRLSMLDIRDAEPEDYAALYLAIQIVIEKAKEQNRSESEEI